jgi:glucose/arabinose dehydrogenase
VRRAIVLAAAVLAVLPAAAHAAPVTLAKVGDFATPVYVTAPLGDTQRVFVVEKGGTIQAVNAAGARSTFLDISAKVQSAENERGLLSMAFALDYATSGLFYVYYTAKSPVGQLTIEEHRVDPADPNRADASYVRTLVTIPHDLQSNHNGGQLQFGPDGYLYAGTGDGGSGGDPSGNAQDTTPAPPSTAGGVNHDYRLGKLLRIDPATGAVGIFAYGLRNPWRFSYDRNTGDLVIGDVGQDRYEEVDFAAAPGDGAGANYGWNTYEGLHTYPGNAPAGAAPGTVLPVIEYPHGPACSITGGYVVRDPALPELAGTYLYGDNCTGELSAATLPGGPPRTLGFNVANVSSFGEDGCGRVYAASLGGPVYRFASSGACAGPAPFVGRLPAGVGGPPPAAGPDRRAPAFTLLRAAARQHALRTGYVSIRVRCDELCSVRASGRVLITRRARASAARALRTRTARATLAAGAKTTLRLKISKSTRRSIKRALARRRVATVRISVRAADKAGNARSRARSVRIVR